MLRDEDHVESVKVLKRALIPNTTKIDTLNILAFWTNKLATWNIIHCIKQMNVLYRINWLYRKEITTNVW